MDFYKILAKLKRPASNILSDKERGLQFTTKVKEKLADVDAPKIKALRTDIADGIALLKAYLTGEYRNIPWQTLITLTGALIYFFNPMDIIPDFVPLTGFVDDAAVLAFVLKSIQSDLGSFKKWRQEKQ